MYEAVDLNPLYGISYYRLKQTDFDGNTYFSRIQKVETTSLIHADVLISPNPVHHEDGTLHINGLGSTEQILVAIQDLVGRKVNTAVYQTDERGSGRFLLSTKELPSGVYIITITTKGASTNKRMVVR